MTSQNPYVKPWRYLIFDLETQINKSHKRVANPWHQDNYVVMRGWKQQGDAQKFQAQTQQVLQVEQIKADAQLQATRATLELQAANDARDSERENNKAQIDAYLKSQEIDFQKWKAELDARVKLRIAQIGKEQSGDELMNAVDDSEAMGKPNPIDQLAQMHAQTLSVVAGLAESIAKPKQIVRDAQGRAQGVI